jgi:hypothetical protein
VSILAANEGGGAALDQVIGMSVAAAIVFAGLVWVGYLHRTRRITWLARLAEAFGRRFKREPWVALPIAMFIATLICALFGFIWDVSLHIGKGRDPGPLANPAHYFILFGLFLLFVAGMTAVVLPYEKPGPAAVRITKNWYAPVGGIVMAGCGFYALLGFPLDDMWHRIFGQDVTLWGPTHLMMIGGAGLSTLAALYLEHEGRLATSDDAPQGGIGLKAIQYLGFGGVVIGMSVYQIEFDFGVSQFRLAFQPMLIALAASFGLVAARIMLGRGAALAAALFSIALRGGVALIVGPILGAPLNWFPLYLGPAVVVELLALTPLLKRPIVFGAVSGLGIATVGLFLESLWIGAVYPYPWPMSMWPEALAMAVPVAILAGACSAMVGMVFTDQPLPRRGIGIGVVVATVLVIGGAVANGLQYTVPKDSTGHPASATVKLTGLNDKTPCGPHDPTQWVQVEEVRTNPPKLVGADPEWFSILAWQGGLDNKRGLAIARLRPKTLPGGTVVYTSTQPIPVCGQWKTLIRLQDGRILTGAALYLPDDPDIGKRGVTVRGFNSPNFEQEINILQRERTFGAPGWLWTVACLIVLACTLTLIASLTWAAGRINKSEMETAGDADAPEPTTPKVQA